MSKTRQSERREAIPTHLTLDEFNEFVLPHLPQPPRFGPPPKVTAYKLFNYILRFLYLGCQWVSLPIDLDEEGKPEIHYTNIYRRFKAWVKHGLFKIIFEGSVSLLAQHGLLDASILHGDGTTTAAKKGGDNLGYSGHKHLKGDKVVAICDRNCNIVAPFIAAPGNRHESPLLLPALEELKCSAVTAGFDFTQSVMSLDSAYDSRANRKKIFNMGMIPNIPENVRNRKSTKRGRKRMFSQSVYKERFFTIERVFAWEDKFKRLLLRFEFYSAHHYALKLLAYPMINLRHFC